ncbi:uncharacterized protein LOC116140805 [Pistacia vera]|uniref:uncharacterized protein LOC116140805 n=1 Tax=Pistacia vera TaxID=55513 RepID=UPI0012632841|nr:uncharacterized protein LOC116140805 [Pistacia vera]
MVDLLQHFHMDSCAPYSTPVGSSKSSLPSDADPFLDVTMYRNMVDSLQYLTLTRSDIVFAINQVADVATLRSVSGGCVFLGRNLICWAAKKQTAVSHSSAESEYRALAHITADVRWFCFLLRDLGIPLYSSPFLLCGN